MRYISNLRMVRDGGRLPSQMSIARGLWLVLDFEDVARPRLAAGKPVFHGLADTAAQDGRSERSQDRDVPFFWICKVGEHKGHEPGPAAFS